jgi:hypothetical protein
MATIAGLISALRHLASAKVIAQLHYICWSTLCRGEELRCSACYGLVVPFPPYLWASKHLWDNQSKRRTNQMCAVGEAKSNVRGDSVFTWHFGNHISTRTSIRTIALSKRVLKGGVICDSCNFEFQNCRLVPAAPEATRAHIVVVVKQDIAPLSIEFHWSFKYPVCFCSNRRTGKRWYNPGLYFNNFSNGWESLRKKQIWNDLRQNIEDIGQQVSREGIPRQSGEKPPDTATSILKIIICTRVSCVCSCTIGILHGYWSDLSLKIWNTCCN